MKGIKSTEQTRMLAKVLFAVYVLYGMVSLPLVQYAVSLAIGGVVYGMLKSIEAALLAVLIVTVVLPVCLYKKVEGFADATPSPSPSPSPSPVPKAEVAQPSQPSQPSQPTGVASHSAATAGGDTPSFTGTSTPASASAAVPAANKISESGVPPVAQPADLINKEDFVDPADAGLFEGGKIPFDEKGGFHLDAGSSVLNALKSLKPDQISAMTRDTKQLIETQKTLMNMLQSFKPMMSEGKEMMSNFQQMFSPGGEATGALETVKNTLKM